MQAVGAKSGAALRSTGRGSLRRLRWKTKATRDSHNFDLQLVEAENQLAKDEVQLAWQGSCPEPTRTGSYSGAIRRKRHSRSGQTGCREALLLSYAKVTAPMAGIVGLRRVDPGNMVHTTDAAGIATINQIKPISVIFTLAADNLPRVLARLNESTPISVEAWSRDYVTKLATGHLTAVDNQIDSGNRHSEAESVVRQQGWRTVSQ